jgi:hypothetical protein
VNRMYRWRFRESVAAAMFAVVLAVSAADAGAQDAASSSPVSDQVVKYDAAFFARYQPNTAYDMVRQVPGFQLDDGDLNRGYAASAGNVLINGRRPSAKQDRPSAILARIPAAQVLSIELIRGQMQGLDMLGQQAVVNVLMLDDAPAAVRWESFFLYSSSGPSKPGLKASLSDRWKAIEYNIGFGIERNSNGEYGPEQVFDGNGQLLEDRYDDEDETGLTLSGLFVNAASWIGRNHVQVNGKFGLVNAPEVRLSSRVPRLPDEPYNVFFRDGQHSETYELGMDAERALTSDLAGKAILLYIRKEADVLSTQSTRELSGQQTFYRQARTTSVSTEGIARMEFDWSGIKDHALQLNVEGAYNELDGNLFQLVDRGPGPVVVNVPGANSVVEEVRGDFLLKDTWSLGKFELDYGLGAESSTITQRGDAVLERDFFFVKPHVVLSHAPGLGQQTRMRLAREVAQLDFEDFISATVYEDDDLALGNPNLRPDTTWVAEVGHERRYGELGVVKVTLFHHWIRDVLDLLPLSDSFEAPGNIGDGRRWGVELENTVPLEWLGLTGARLDVKLRWQDSSVTDPVTGLERQLTANAGFSGPPAIRFRSENDYVYIVAYRQDLQASHIAWGWDVAEQAERPIYKVNELEINDEGVLINLFVETTRWFGLKFRVEGNNLLDYDELRDRFIYTGARDLTPLESRIVRNRAAGRRLNLVVSGTF